MKNWVMALGTLALVGTACNPIVLDPLHDGTQDAQSPSSSDPSSGPSQSGAGSPQTSVLAARAGDLPQNVPLFSPGSASSGLLWNQPESLVLLFSGDPQQCSQPVLQPICRADTPFWQLMLTIPPELDRPGLIDLRDRGVIMNESVVLPSDNAVDCGGGFGSGNGYSGTLEIVSSDPTELTVKLSGGVRLLDGTTLDGEYTVPRCGAAPIVAPPASAVAIRAANLPGDPSTTTSGGGASLDPDTLFVFLGTGTETCEDPWSSFRCDVASRLTFSLPPALQLPGVIDLSDPAIHAAFNAAAPGAAPTCGAPSVPLTEGTIEILSSGAGGLSFRLYGSYTAGVPCGVFGVDGLYATSICP